jgi:hypothetical protein
LQHQHRQRHRQHHERDAAHDGAGVVHGGAQQRRHVGGHQPGLQRRDVAPQPVQRPPRVAGQEHDEGDSYGDGRHPERRRRDPQVREQLALDHVDQRLHPLVAHPLEQAPEVSPLPLRPRQVHQPEADDGRQGQQPGDHQASEADPASVDQRGEHQDRRREREDAADVRSPERHADHHQHGQEQPHRLQPPAAGRQERSQQTRQ